MQCYNCGETVRPTDGVCGKCGSPLDFSKEMIDAATAGEEAAVSYLYNATYNNVYQTIRPLIKDEDNALDILQDTYVKAFQSLGQLEEPKQFRAWVKRIAANKSKDWLKKKKPTLFSELRPDDEDGEVDFVDDRDFEQPDTVLDKAETKRLLWEIIDSLSDEQRLVVSMYYFEEMQVKEIALELGIPENTVKSRLNYARKNIESKVLYLEKQGTKLYGLTPVPMLLWLFRASLAQGANVPSQTALAAITKSLAAAGAAGSGGAAAAAAGAAKAGIGSSIALKIAAGAVALAIVAGVGAVVLQGADEKAPPETVSALSESEETPSPAPVTEEPLVEEPPEEESPSNEARIAAYMPVVQSLQINAYGNSFGETNRFLLYDYDGDGLDELLAVYTTGDDGGNKIHAAIYSVNADGESERVFFSDLAANAGGPNVHFSTLSFRGEEYLAYFYTNSNEISSGGTSYLFEARDGKLETAHEIAWRIGKEDIPPDTTPLSPEEEYVRLDGEDLDRDEFNSMRQSIRVLARGGSDTTGGIGLTGTAFQAEYEQIVADYHAMDAGEEPGADENTGAGFDVDPEELYADILAQYREVVRNDFYPEHSIYNINKNEAVNAKNVDVELLLEARDFSGELYYAFYDIDGNGVPELLLCAYYTYPNPSAIITVENGVLRQVGFGGDRAILNVLDSGLVMLYIRAGMASESHYYGFAGGALAEISEEEYNSKASENPGELLTNIDWQVFS